MDDVDAVPVVDHVIAALLKMEQVRTSGNGDELYIEHRLIRVADCLLPVQLVHDIRRSVADGEKFCRQNKIVQF